MLGLLAFCAAMLGGSSRPDAIQLTLLRPLSALFLIPALYALHKGDWKQQRFLVLLLLALAGWMLVQVIPLPPSIWHALPGREAIVEMDAILGLQDLWRPIALSQWRGWNALASLVLPAAGLLLAIATRADQRQLFLIIAALAVMSAWLSLMQLAGGPTSLFYFYAQTNENAPVGIFANENHTSIFLALSLLVIAKLAIDGFRAGERGMVRVAYPAAYLLIIIITLVIGSRAGFVGAFLAFVASALMVWTSLPQAKRSPLRRRKGLALQPTPRMLGAIAIGLVLLAAALLVGMGRVPALTEMVAGDGFEDLRWSIWPVFLDMTDDFWLVGIGFGSFEETYHIYEPVDLLLNKYVNQAHNDWIQLVMEGGVIAVVILLALLGWIARSIWTLGTADNPEFPAKIFWVTVFGIIAFASLFDYPLRAPTFQLVAVWLLVGLALESGTSRKRRNIGANSA